MVPLTQVVLEKAVKLM